MTHLPRLALAFVLSSSVVCAAGCGTVSIGRGPTDLDLQNDGSPEAQQALQKRYALAYAPFSLRRPGASTEQVSAEIEQRVAEVRTPAWSDEAADYLATSAAADELVDTPAVGFDRFSHGPVPTTMLFVGSVLVGAGLGMAAEVNVGRVDAGTFANVSWGALNGAVGGALFSLPLMIVYNLTVPLLSATLASSDYKKAARAYNVDLEQRIRAGAAPAPAPAPPAPPPPAAAAPQTDAPNPTPEAALPQADPAAPAVDGAGGAPSTTP